MSAALPAYAIAILMAAGPDDGCPSPHQLAEALAAHLPGMVLPLGHATSPTTLRLSVTTDAASTLRLDLSDPEGGPLLHRLLPANEHAKAGDCPALAETAALIVERYWHEVGYDVPIETPAAPTKPASPKATSPPPKPAETAPPKPTPEPAPRAAPPVVEAPPAAPLPPPRWSIGLGAGELWPDAGSRASWATAAVAIERPVFKRRVGLRLSAGAETSVAVDFATGSAEVRQIPVRMGGYLPIALGLGRLEPGVGLDLDVISVDFTRKGGTGSGSENRLAASPGVDAALAWAWMLPHDVYVRALADAVTSVAYQVVTASNNTRIFNTPRFTLSLGLELGLWFR